MSDLPICPVCENIVAGPESHDPILHEAAREKARRKLPTTIIVRKDKSGRGELSVGLLNQGGPEANRIRIGVGRDSIVTSIHLTEGEAGRLIGALLDALDNMKARV
jgi:hypothetical protein